MAERWTHELLRAYLEDEERGESPVEGGEWSVERREYRVESGVKSGV